MRTAPLIGAVGALALVLWLTAIGNRGSIYMRDNALDHAACVGSSITLVLPGKHHAGEDADPSSCAPQRASAAPGRYRLYASG